MPGTKRDGVPGRRQLAPRPRRHPRILHCVAITAVSLLALAGVLILVFWLVVRPSLLRYSVNGAHVQGFDLSGSALKATFNLTVEARNPNHKVAVCYDQVEVAVWYDGQLLASDEAAPFYQPSRDVRVLKADPVARSTPLLGSVAASLERDRSSRGMAVEVRLRAVVRFKLGLLKTDRYALQAYCSPVFLRFSPLPRAKFEKVACDVYF
ncbi:protein YLS9-like [Canna indica]|uniref:Protein YLS9-like n=1 Tax=Canna indica TaxID=4628 RepID=A0AAQ3KLU1_9LILI|nr:protein YLS9-like [Canna indica]